jgi:hypothetical protein
MSEVASEVSSLCRRLLLSSGPSFQAEIGYSRAVVVGGRMEVAGTTGLNYRTMEISDSIVEQTRQCLANISEALHAVGSWKIENDVSAARSAGCLPTHQQSHRPIPVQRLRCVPTRRTPV